MEDVTASVPDRNKGWEWEQTSLALWENQVNVMKFTVITLIVKQIWRGTRGVLTGNGIAESLKPATSVRFRFIQENILASDLFYNYNVKYLYCSTQHRERKIVFSYTVLPVCKNGIHW